MCGIYGITGNAVTKITKMMEICSHRGPDGNNIFCNDDITFGHNLLSITSNPGDAVQPWSQKNSENILVYNGEIFNYEELIKKFHNQFYPKTTCDTELLFWMLNNFSYKEVVSNFIDSMHAFAFYNKRKKEIILSRDHAGIKPLYFSLGSGGLIFSSEIKALTEFVYNSKKLNRTAFMLTSFLGTNPLRDTLFSGIYKLLPGETIVYDIQSKKINETFKDIVTPLSKNKFDENEFISLTKKIIKNSTLGIRQFGIFLSGGLDSTLISYELKNYVKNMGSFTNYMSPNIITREEDYNSDAKIAKKLSDELSFDHHEIKITPEIIADQFDASIRSIEEPTYNWNQAMYFYTNKFLSSKGVTITMAGDIGDEILGGYIKYYNFLNTKKRIDRWDVFLSYWMNKLASPIKLNLKFNKNDIHNLLVENLPGEIWNPTDLANTAMALDCITNVPEDFFKRNDRFGMAFSMEGRFPLASKEYMKYCLNIDSSEKFGLGFEGGNKMFVRKAYKDMLPSYVLSKSKTGWSVPVSNWIHQDNPLRDKFIKDQKKESGIDQIFHKENYDISISGKRSIITWMFTNWARQFDMYL